jgi:hypothetical protein
MLRAQYDKHWLVERGRSSEAVVFYDGVHDYDSGSECAQHAFMDYLDALKATHAQESSEEAAESSDVEEISSASEDEEINTRAAEIVLTTITALEPAAYQTAATEVYAAEHASLAKYLLSDTAVTSLETNLNVDSKDVDSIKLCLRRNELIKLFPIYARQIRALAYEAGLFTSKDSAGYDPTMNSFFRHDEMLSEAELPNEIAAFSQTLREFTQKYSVDVTAGKRQTM